MEVVELAEVVEVGAVEVGACGGVVAGERRARRLWEVIVWMVDGEGRGVGEPSGSCCWSIVVVSAEDDPEGMWPGYKGGGW